jgi:rubrerythrin
MNEKSGDLKALKTAIQMEIDGKKYYQKAGKTSSNDLGRKLFQSLALEEDIHRRKFVSIFQALQAQDAWPEVDFTPHKGKELRSLFAEAAESVAVTPGELEAVETAMGMENKTLDFYTQQAGQSSLEIEKKYYSLLAGEESAHHAVLYDYFEYLKDPAGWFTMKERHSLDGG